MTKYPESQISFRFALRVTISEIWATLHFRIGHNVKFQTFFLNFTFEIPNSQQANSVGIVTGNLQKKFGWKKK